VSSNNWVIANKDWFFPLWFGGLALILMVKWAFEQRRMHREDKRIKQFMDSILKTRMERDRGRTSSDQ
jgi:hypothetical protein